MLKRYTNPIIKGFYPDPSICKANDKYYLVTSTFEYFPGVPIFESEDLVNWEQIGHCLARETQLNLKNSAKSKGIYAPTLRHHKGTFYMITTNVTTGENFIVTTSDPSKEWSDAVVIENWKGIDPSLYFENDRLFLQGNSYQSNDKLGIYQVELDLNTLQPKSERVYICEGTGGKAPEAPHVFKKDDFYYLVAAEGGTEYGHMVTIFRSKDINGPYLPNPSNPILTNRSEKNLLQCVGHADFIEDFKGNWWLVCLGIRYKGSHAYYHHLGRETMLAPVKWDDSGWPIVNETGSLNVEMSGPLVNDQSLKSNNVNINFEDDNLELIYLRNPNTDNYQFEDKSLIMTGSEKTINDIDEVSFIGLRHRDFDMSYSVDFEIISDADFGVTSYMSHDFHYDIHFNYENKSLSLIKRMGTINFVEAEVIIPETSKIRLIIESDEKYYYFYYVVNNEKYNLGKGECIFLSSEISATFTGVILGAYCYSNKDSKVKVTNIKYKETTL